MCWYVRFQMAEPTFGSRSRASKSSVISLQLAHGLTVTTIDINDGALPAQIWNGADSHVVSGTRFLRCCFPGPQLGRCSNLTQTAPSEASKIKYFRVERRATALRTGSEGIGWPPWVKCPHTPGLDLRPEPRAALRLPWANI